MGQGLRQRNGDTVTKIKSSRTRPSNLGANSGIMNVAGCNKNANLKNSSSEYGIPHVSVMSQPVSPHLL